MVAERKTHISNLVEQFLIENSLTQQVDIRTGRREVTIQCKDMYEIATKEKKKFGLIGLHLTLPAIKPLPNVYGGIETAIISLLMEATRKVKTNWVMCLLKEQVILM